MSYCLDELPRIEKLDRPVSEEVLGNAAVSVPSRLRRAKSPSVTLVNKQKKLLWNMEHSNRIIRPIREPEV
jgi:hypothetical protein